MHISVVIPTCDRKARLLSLLQNLENSVYPIHEVIIVDSGENSISENDYRQFKNKIIYLRSERSVCIQRNIGIKQATSDWIFLCDDDVELPADYLLKLSAHVSNNHECGAVSGLWMEKEKCEWKGNHPENSSLQVIWKFIFQLGIWGEINCRDFVFVRRIKKYYKKKGNHISKAGWPILTDFSNDHFVTPVYSLGASLIKRAWLENSMYDEVLDPHGMGDNYGVAVSFPGNIHVLNNTMVYHHLEPINRLQKPLQYFRRVLALDYFIQSKKNLKNVAQRWLIWSLIGNLLSFTLAAEFRMAKACLKAIIKIVFGKNPYYEASKLDQKIVQVDII